MILHSACPVANKKPAICGLQCKKNVNAVQREALLPEATQKHYSSEQGQLVTASGQL